MEQRKHIKLKHGYVTVLGAGEPTGEFLDALNKMAEIAAKNKAEIKAISWLSNQDPEEVIIKQNNRPYEVRYKDLDGFKFFEIGNLSFDRPVRYNLFILLNRLYLSRERVEIVYGDPSNGKRWSDPSLRGRIGRSTGNVKIPLLIKTARSIGGEGLLCGNILFITDAKSRNMIYNYAMDNSEIIDPKKPEV